MTLLFYLRSPAGNTDTGGDVWDDEDVSYKKRKRIKTGTVAQIQYENVLKRKEEDEELLSKLGAFIEDDIYMINIDLEKLFTLNSKLESITDEYWDVIVGEYLDEKCIFISKVI